MVSKVFQLPPMYSRGFLQPAQCVARRLNANLQCVAAVGAGSCFAGGIVAGWATRVATQDLRDWGATSHSIVAAA